ncbi:MAG: carboxypeptidase-like regulatory domain-containing protein, partial [Gemmatimonadota bacterium]|nr:carboxypeptidase-like regulatory domain-containing protein [Gemmatimonadota bacterium]
MKSFVGGLIVLILSVSVGAEPLLEGRVRLSSGQPAVGVQVRLFDLADLRRFVGTTTDEAGHFALPLQAFSTARGTAPPTGFVLGQNYPNPFNPS